MTIQETGRRTWCLRQGKDARERAFAVVLIVVLSPLLLACALAIAIESVLFKDARGPIILREARVGGGDVIQVMKFRTLNREGLENLEGSYIKVQEKAGRVSRVGHFLKRWYLDESAQLFNVARGDMGFIGIRPQAMEVFEAESDEWKHRLTVMPPGLIGPAVAKKGDEDLDPDAEYDRYYEAYKTYSGWKLLKLDVSIVGATIRMAARHEGL